jgi:hypothetical protein
MPTRSRHAKPKITTLAAAVISGDSVHLPVVVRPLQLSKVATFKLIS